MKHNIKYIVYRTDVIAPCTITNHSDSRRNTRNLHSYQIIKNLRTDELSSMDLKMLGDTNGKLYKISDTLNNLELYLEATDHNYMSAG